MNHSIKPKALALISVFACIYPAAIAQDTNAGRLSFSGTKISTKGGFFVGGVSDVAVGDVLPLWRVAAGSLKRA
jgi:hypothetical protein